jgi:hypothetical protein
VFAIDLGLLYRLDARQPARKTESLLPGALHFK